MHNRPREILRVSWRQLTPALEYVVTDGRGIPRPEVTAVAARSAWKGYLKFSLVSIPVKAYTAVSSSSGVRLNQLHADCNARIQYKKVCPVHGEVSNDAIVSGYEYAKGQYVIIDPAETDKLRTEDDKAINIDTFITTKALDPVYYSGRSYYLVPDGPVGQKPYTVLCEAMAEEGRQAIAPRATRRALALKDGA